MRFGVPPPRYGFLVIALQTLFRSFEVSAFNSDASFVFCVCLASRKHIFGEWRLDLLLTTAPPWEGWLPLLYKT